VQENFFSVFSIASLVKKTLPFKIVSLYSIFFSKIGYQDRFNRYIFEYRCPSLQFSRFRMKIAGGLPTLDVENAVWVI
jgi:hypothetical protein